MPHTSNRANLKDSPKIRVLLVDDSKAFLRIAASFLQRQHELIFVGAICGSEEALAQARDLQPQVILIGLEKVGLETIICLRNMLPGIGTIALTLLERTTHRQAAIAAGADDLVFKAELLTDLLPAIQRATQADRSW